MTIGRALAIGAVTLTVVGIVCVPLWISCTVLELDSPISIEQAHRVSRAGLLLLITFLLTQPAAGAMLTLRFFPKAGRWWAGAGSVALAIASFVVGLLINNIGEARWRDLALSLFG